jgi:hypothetical protein
VTRRRVVLFALVLMLTGLVVAAVGVHLMLGLPAGLMAYGAASVLTGVSVVVLWA